jgi:hypothetical protein
MKVTMMLADAADHVQGKLYILGGGWSLTGPEPAPWALAIKIEVPWNEANRQHEVILRLVDADDRPVLVEGQPLEIRGQIEVGRPPGLPAGTPLDAMMALNMPPLPLQPGTRFVWRLSINGQSQEDWHVGFMTRPAAPRGATMGPGGLIGGPQSGAD